MSSNKQNKNIDIYIESTITGKLKPLEKIIHISTNINKLMAQAAPNIFFRQNLGKYRNIFTKKAIKYKCFAKCTRQ